MFRIKNKKLNIFQLTDSELEKAGVSKASKNFLEALDNIIFILALFASGLVFALVLVLLFLIVRLF
jgi:hypothetical protein